MALHSKVNLRKLKGHPRYNWRATFKEGGKVQQKYFKTKAEAETFKSEREQENLASGTEQHLTNEERSAVLEFRADLERVGITVREALKMAVAFKERTERSAPVATLIAEFIKKKEGEGKSIRYLQDLRSRLARFSESFGASPVAAITTEQVSDWLEGLDLAPVTVQNFRRLLVVLFNEGKRRRYCQENPAEDSHSPNVTETEIGIVTPSEAGLLLESASEAILPAVAIGLFAGVRDAEIKRLDWKEIDLVGRHIEIKPSKSKSSRRRLIKIQDNLAAWLQPHAKLSGKVWPVNGRKLMDAARSKAGFDDEEKPWPHNAARHSFASYHLAKFQNAPELALEMGHTDTRIIFQSYRELVRPAVAETYWSLAPATQEKIVAISA